LKKIYVIRHCEAKGQPSGSPLTDKGLLQAKYLVDFFRHTKIDRMIASPFLRAIQSVQPLSEEREISIEDWKNLSKPDVFQVNYNQNGVDIKRIWKEDNNVISSN